VIFFCVSWVMAHRRSKRLSQLDTWTETRGDVAASRGPAVALHVKGASTSYRRRASVGTTYSSLPWDDTPVDTCKGTASLRPLHHNSVSTDANAAADFLFLRGSSAVSLRSREPGACKVSSRRIWRSKSLKNQPQHQPCELDLVSPQQDLVMPQQSRIVGQIIDLLGTLIQSPPECSAEDEKPRQRQCFRGPELRRTCRLRALSVEGRAGSPVPTKRSFGRASCGFSQEGDEDNACGEWESLEPPTTPGRRAEEPEGEPRVQTLRWTRRFKPAACDPGDEDPDFDFDATSRRLSSRSLSSLHCRRTSLSQSSRGPDKDSPETEELVQAPTQIERHIDQQKHRCSGTGGGELEAEDQTQDFHTAPLLPPSSSSWEWPLTRSEKKALINMFDRRMLIADNRLLEEEVCHLRRNSCTGMWN